MNRSAPKRYSAHGRGTPRRLQRLALIPGLVWIITALWAVLLVGASLLWPMSYGEAEPQHIDMAYAYSAEPFHFYGPGKLLPSQATVYMQQQVPGYPPREKLSVAKIAFRGDRPSFAAMGGHSPTEGAAPNPMVQHPPLYYWAEAALLRAPGVSHLPWDKQVWLMRLLSVLFMLPVPILAWATAKRVLTYIHPSDDGPRLALVAAVVPLTLPNLIRDGSSVTNEALLILASSTLLYLACLAMTGDLSRRTSIWTGAALAVAMLTKGSALVLPPIVLVAFLLGAARSEREEQSRSRVPWPALVVPAVGCAIGGAWWMRNLVEYGQVRIDGYGSSYERALFGPPHDDGGVLTFVPKFFDFFISRIWGGIGLRDMPSLGPFLVYGWFAVVMIGVLGSIFVRSEKGSRARTLTLLAAPVFTMALLLVNSYTKYHKWPSVPIDPRGSQGRYVYHLIVVIAALTMLGWQHLLQRRVRAWLLPITLIGAIITNAVAWLFVLSTWYQPPHAAALHGYLDAVHGLLRWSPVPKPMTATLVFVLPSLLSAVAIVAGLRSARSARAIADSVSAVSGPDDLTIDADADVVPERAGR